MNALRRPFSPVRKYLSTTPDQGIDFGIGLAILFYQGIYLGIGRTIPLVNDAREAKNPEFLHYPIWRIARHARITQTTGAPEWYNGVGYTSMGRNEYTWYMKVRLSASVNGSPKEPKTTPNGPAIPRTSPPNRWL
jgi:hypothetical protein